jgi:diaminobutyrate-2-oxoglutarate transaminase
MRPFDRLESEVRSYCRSFPTVFATASGHLLRDENGREYIDFFAGAGALNYGHNEPYLKSRLLEYLGRDGVVHTLDMHTHAKREFLEAFEERVLTPRDLEYKLMFPGPTGTNAVESALKLARKITGRTSVIAFSNAFHGMTLGSLALTGNSMKRAGAGVELTGVDRMPFHGYLGPDVNTAETLARFLEDGSSGVEPPAAIVLETVQAEGGVNVASRSWLRKVARLARRHGALLVIDDIQVGCGRTGPFFSFEWADLKPDLVCLSKSISGYGLPFALTLIRPEIDRWDPGEHNGTFRGHNPAFVTGTAALERYWSDATLEKEVARKAQVVRKGLAEVAAEHGGEVRGRGLIQGIEFTHGEFASGVSKRAFERGLIVETAGPRDEVLKLLPPLNIPPEELDRGLSILRESVEAEAAERDMVAVAVGSGRLDG